MAYVQIEWPAPVDLHVNRLTIFIAAVPADASLPTAPAQPPIGLDHLGLRVDDADAATAELKRRGAQVLSWSPRPSGLGCRLRSFRALENVCGFELLARTVRGEVPEAAGRGRGLRPAPAAFVGSAHARQWGVGQGW